MDALSRKISTIRLRQKSSTAPIQATVVSLGSRRPTQTSCMSAGSFPTVPVDSPLSTCLRDVPRIFYYPEGTPAVVRDISHSNAALASAFDAAACKRPQETQANVQCFMVGAGRNIQLQVFPEEGPYEEDYQSLAATLGTLHQKYLVIDMKYLICPTCVNELRIQENNKRSWFHRNFVATPSWTGSRYRVKCRHEPTIEKFLKLFSQYRPIENIKLLRVKLGTLHDPDMLASATETILTHFPKLEKLVLEVPTEADDNDATISHLKRIKLKSCVRILDTVYDYRLRLANPNDSNRHVDGWRKHRVL